MTNGLGGYASGTVAGVSTRRYHGLLTAALNPPVGRVLLLSKFEEKLLVEGQSLLFRPRLFGGDVKAARLTIADGAVFKGNVDMDV